MATTIKKIESISIDGRNQVFGGYIYSLDYDANFGEQPSVVKIYVVNQTGQYNISEDDLTTQGSPVQIKIGTKITLFMYPMSYSYEDTPDGKLLQVEYLDESITYLDKKVVKISEPMTITQYGTINPNISYDNTIVLGSEDFTDLELSNTQRTLLEKGNYTTNTQAVIYHVPINYTFPQLLAQISSFVARAPTLDVTSSLYRKDYSGRLREVLSAWCNDLGLGFYWEDRKLNFVDLRNPANLSAVKSLSDSIKVVNKVSGFNESYSIRDTFTRAIHGTIYENGEAVSSNDIGTDPDTNYYLSNIKVENIPWVGSISSYVRDSGSTFAMKTKAAYYGVGFFKLFTIAGKDNIGKDVQDVYDQSKIAFKFIAKGTGTSSTIVSVVKDTGITAADYNWYSYAYKMESSITKQFQVFEALAKFRARFFYFGISSEERGKKLFGDDVKWYHGRQRLAEIDQIMRALDPVREFISNVETISLTQFLNNGAGNSSLTAQQISTKQYGTEGYIIKELTPSWSPEKSEKNSYELGDYVIIEGDSTKSEFKTDIAGQSFPLFYLGAKTSGSSSKKLTADDIKFPSTEPLIITVTSAGFSSVETPDITPRTAQFVYRPPTTANVNYYDLNKIEINSDLVRQYGSFSSAVDNQAAGIPQQIDPFFSSQITVPNIDLAGPSLSLGTGLQAFSINFTDNGVKSTYTIGSERMKLRNPDVFYRYIYDPKKKKQDVVAVPSISIRHIRNYNRIK